MKAADPSIKIGVPVTEDYWFSADHWTPALFSALKDEGVTPDFVIVHSYPQLPGGESDATLLQAASKWPDKAAYVRQLLNKRFGPTAAGVELFCTENNSIPLKPGKQTTSLVNGLFLADSFGQIAQTEFKSFFWWNWCNGLNAGRDTTNNNSASLYGWRNYGTYGMLSRDRQPTFYTFKLLQWFARPGDHIVRAASNHQLLAVYAARRSNGSLALLVINKSPTNALTVNCSIANFRPAPTALVYDYGIPQDEAARTGPGLQDIAQTVFSDAAPQFSRVFPPYSATVIALSPPTAK